MRYFPATRATFIEALNLAKESRGSHGLCVSEPEGNGHLLMLAEDRLSGFAISGDYVGSVFTNAAVKGQGRLKAMLDYAAGMVRMQGGEYLTLDCFEPLAKVYQAEGFESYEVVPFVWEYAPEGWTEAMGEPSVHFMSRKV